MKLLGYGEDYGNGSRRILELTAREHEALLELRRSIAFHRGRPREDLPGNAIAMTEEEAAELDERTFRVIAVLANGLAKRDEAIRVLGRVFDAAEGKT